MKKLKLDIEALAVQSFDVTGEAGEGTVLGMSVDTGCGCPETGPKCPAPPPFTQGPDYTCQDQGTCRASCTCPPCFW